MVNWVRVRLLSRLNDAKLLELQQSHKSYFFNMAVEGAPRLRFTPDASWIQRLEANKANLLTAFRLSRGEERTQFGMALWRWAYISTHIDETRRILHLSRFACKSFPPLLLPEFYRAQGCTYYRQSKYGVAKSFFEHAFRVACEQENGEEAGYSSQLLASLYDEIGDVAEAERWCKTSNQYWQKAGSLWGQAMIQNLRGILAWKEDRFSDAKAFYELSCSFCQQINDKQLLARILNNAGILAQSQKEYNVAEKAYRQSLANRAIVPDQRHHCLTLNNLAIVCYKQKKFRQANALFYQALVLMNKIGYTSKFPCILVGLGEAANLQGNNKFAALCLSLAEHLDPNHTDGYSISDRQELEQNIVEVRTAIGPQMFERLRKKSQHLTINDIIAQLSK